MLVLFVKKFIPIILLASNLVRMGVKKGLISNEVFSQKFYFTFLL